MDIEVKNHVTAEQWREVLFRGGVEAKQKINLDVALVVPPEGKRSSSASGKEMEWYSWQLRVNCIFHDGPPFKLQYPVMVDDFVAERKKWDDDDANRGEARQKLARR
jgi:hypothetical protein